jgi:hypothetical protein
MNEALALPQGLDAISVREPIPFVGFHSKRSAKQLSGSAEELVRSIATVIDQWTIGAIEKRTAAEFHAVWNEVFPSYANVMFALGKLAHALIPANVLQQVALDSLCEMEADFRDHALVAFGAAIKEQGLFTVWTIRKINDLAQQLRGEITEDDKEKEGQFASGFIYHGLRARFNLECLLTSMKRDCRIYPEVLAALSDGLRSGVDAYAWIRQAVDLRNRIEEPVLPYADMDDEDLAFVQASAYDMARDLASESA